MLHFFILHLLRFLFPSLSLFQSPCLLYTASPLQFFIFAVVLYRYQCFNVSSPISTFWKSTATFLGVVSRYYLFWKPTWHNFTLCFFTYAWVICSFTLSDHPSSSFTLDRFGKSDFFRNSEDIFWLHSSGVALKIPCMTIVYDFVFRNTGRTYFLKSDCVCMRLEGVD